MINNEFNTIIEVDGLECYEVDGLGPPSWKEVDIMWAAGFFEGEGSVAQRAINASQVNIWPLQKLKQLFGGTIGTNARRDPRRIGVSQPIWQWHISGQAGRAFVAAIYPYLSPRRQSQIDSKFITEEKFAIRRREVSPKQREHLSKAIANKNIVTGRFTRAS